MQACADVCVCVCVCVYVLMHVRLGFSDEDSTFAAVEVVNRDRQPASIASRSSSMATRCLVLSKRLHSESRDCSDSLCSNLLPDFVLDQVFPTLAVHAQERTTMYAYFHCGRAH
jgi:hypothetical protein